MTPFALADNQVVWAWKMLCDGHPQQQVADALHVHARTLQRAMYRNYGRATPVRINELEAPGPIWRRTHG